MDLLAPLCSSLWKLWSSLLRAPSLTPPPSPHDRLYREIKYTFSCHKLLSARVLYGSKEQLPCNPPLQGSRLTKQSLALPLSYEHAKKIDPEAIFIQDLRETAFGVQANICIFISKSSAVAISVGTGCIIVPQIQFDWPLCLFILCIIIA